MQEGYYGGGGGPKRMTRKQINEMINNMKKTNVISEKSIQYHKKEELEADAILEKLENKDKNK